MLSDEEKVIEELKNKKADYFMISNLMSKTLLYLIEKQSKEIEELKDINKKLEARKYMLNARTGEVTAIPIDNNYISKDKIKAKIEELSNGTYDAKIVLQSLLEKE